MDIAKIRANDAEDGEEIIISIIPGEYDGEQGYRLAASNGEDIAHYRPQSVEKCREDALASWGRWSTFELL